MRVAITGSSGLVGSRLADVLLAAGHSVLRLVRERPESAGESTAYWNPARQELSRFTLKGVDAVVHLAGENIAARRWNEECKKRIAQSRIEGTRLLAEALAGLDAKPTVWVSASAVGYYGNRGSESLTEESAPGQGFLSDLCKQWEAAAHPAVAAGVRVVHPRFGMVLAAHGGALGKMLPPFRLGLGGPIGPGTQYISWVTLRDAVAALCFMLENAALAGPVNVTAPEPVTNADFSRALGAALHRPAKVPLPAFAARLAFGEMADELLLSSTRALPAKLKECGFRFDDAAVGPALCGLVGV